VAECHKGVELGRGTPSPVGRDCALSQKIFIYFCRLKWFILVYFCALFVDQKQQETCMNEQVQYVMYSHSRNRINRFLSSAVSDFQLIVYLLRYIIE